MAAGIRLPGVPCSSWLAVPLSLFLFFPRPISFLRRSHPCAHISSHSASQFFPGGTYCLPYIFPQLSNPIFLHIVTLWGTLGFSLDGSLAGFLLLNPTPRRCQSSSMFSCHGCAYFHIVLFWRASAFILRCGRGVLRRTLFHFPWCSITTELTLL